MAVFLIPMIIPFLWATLITCYWYVKVKKPFNHPLFCVLVFAINFFWFNWAFFAFLVIAIFNSVVVNKKKEDEHR